MLYDVLVTLMVPVSALLMHFSLFQSLANLFNFEE
jgi:hypothetical protein